MPNPGAEIKSVSSRGARASRKTGELSTHVEYSDRRFIDGRQEKLLPEINPRAYEKVLTHVSQDSVYDCILHYGNGVGRSSYDHMVMGGVKAAITSGQLEKIVSLRKIIQFAGHGFSTLYKYWPDADEIFKDIWLYSLECYMMSELEHLRQLGKNSPRHFIDAWSSHIVLAQNCIPIFAFSLVLEKYYGGDVSRMLLHVPGHTQRVVDLYKSFFSENPDAAEITDDLRKEFVQSVPLITTYLFIRNTKPRTQESDRILIASIRRFIWSYLGRP